MSHEQRLLRHATGMVIVTFLSRVTGYLRDKALAWVLGAEALNDAFRTAFRIPNAFRALLAEGALHAAFVPALARLSDEGASGREARELVRGLAAALLLATSIVVGLGIVLSPWLVRLYAPGFAGDSATLEATVLMNRLMFPYLALVSLAALLQGVLNSRERFLLPAATPIALNLAMAAGAWWLARGSGQAPVVLSLSVLVGGALQFLLQLPAVRALGFHVRPLWRALRSPTVSSVLLLMLPGIAVLGLNQINQFVTNRFASTLGEGAVTVQFYAYRVTELMYGGIVVQLTTVLLPVMSRQLRQEPAAASVTLLDTVRLVSFITLPTATVLAVAARPVIGLLFGGGRFDVAAVTATGAALAAYAFGLVALGHAKVVASAFFAQQDTRTPMVGSALSLVIFTVACWLLSGPLGVPGLGLANTIAMSTYAVLLTAAYVRLYGLPGAPVGPTVVAVGRQVAASAVVGWGLWLTRPWLAGVERTGGHEALRVFAVLGLVSVAYVVLVVLMGGREPATLLAAVRGRGRS
ncbi:MAG: murein biosynthesis integral membrane protein MurJ [Holophagae bacterium]|nr:MAG: murein biosynthesis integral membrane protein MurJ [Holophagae bacterium]